MAIIVGYVPTPEGVAALESAIDEAQRRHQRLVVVNSSRGESLVDKRFASGTEWQSVEERLTASGVDHELTQLVESKDAADQILKLATELNAELIVIGLRRRTPVGKLLLGSQAQTILLEAECPVLAVKSS
ncbi:nucleotide-binding universal stress UspA family protein [Kribbella orskensis]|uniref:Nucleotide-binding universal stress UspA family protein n=1 Tax=Kribbella orskensis TaxID=2512216 RepID=A0ABY2B9G8_9ACTN|nr:MULTISPECIES: universal stress protein [Kribbella]TCN30044.1 nucleotide-binding universal stress UspA family protein [Kribbella sp. VKM Ac-2500]TCO10226.1 nucleotide-binding universal stress UspA family protein [Kribbella orskensis]